MDALSTKRLATGALIFAATLLFLSATSEPTSTAVNLLVDDHDKSDAIMATGTRMQMTEYADNGQRLYSLRVAEWTQYRGTENTHIELLQPEMRLFDDSDTTPLAGIGPARQRNKTRQPAASDFVRSGAASTDHAICGLCVHEQRPSLGGCRQ